MQASYLALACLLLAGTVYGHGRELEQSSGASCTSFGSLKIVVKDGFCKGWARTSCQAHAEADIEIKQAIDDLFKQKGINEICEVATLRLGASAIARAFARVHTQALSQVTCSGKGFGCGFTLSAGSSFATAYAETIVKAVTGVIDADLRLRSLCIADLRAIGVGLARAVSASFSKACVSGSGSARRFESNLAEATVKIVTFAFVKATSAFCSTADALKAKSSSACNIDGGAGSVGGPVAPTGQSPRSSSSTSGGGSTRGGSTGSAVATKLKSCWTVPQRNCCFKIGPCPSGVVKFTPAGPHTAILESPVLGNCACY